jgi:anti-anti-sigma factor
MTRLDDLDPLPALEIEEAAPQTLLVRVRGDLDADATARMHAELAEELAGAAIVRVLVDLSRVTLLGPEALRLLRHLHRRCRAENAHLVLIGTARPEVNRPLRTSGLLPLLDTRPSVQAALCQPYATPPVPGRRGRLVATAPGSDDSLPG